ncbi:MAG: lipolytic enzyme [Planctomycetota bacterium]|nr:MAG: lipolytic enzyme [Planctomycetota bacterium]
MLRSYVFVVVAAMLLTPQLDAVEPNRKPAPLTGAASLAGKRVMVLGDSVTQDGRYLSYVEYYLQKQNPSLNFDIINAGLASETTSGLTEEGHPGPRPCIHDRLDRALADIKPELVIACYGMNDGIYKPLSKEREEAFHNGIMWLVEKCLATGAEVILVTPPAFDVDCQGGVKASGFDYNSVLDVYADWELKTRPGGATVIDLHIPMSKQVKPCREAGHPLHNHGDGVHPADMGHFVIAQAIMQGLAMPLPEGDLAKQMAEAQADPLYQLVRKRQSARGNGWLHYIGFTRVNKTTEPHLNDIQVIEAQAAEDQKAIDALRQPKR